MANLLRSAKSGNDWTTNDLLAYNIRYSNLASKANLDQDSAFEDFAREILRALGYEKPRLCLAQSSSTVLLVVQGDKPTLDSPEPQIIAELNSMTIPCITMTGTRPILYMVPVTRHLSEAVVLSQYPLSPTMVKKCVVASNSRRPGEGMETPDFRQVSLQHYTAFRKLAEAHWSAFMIPMEMRA
ncbi:hypothetical protein F5887DRAFT_1061156 [Amanita rubescens]|nr:hypothetical protein F5887DRAFT_1061156 [Amanita rubescens]